MPCNRRCPGYYYILSMDFISHYNILLFISGFGRHGEAPEHHLTPGAAQRPAKMTERHDENEKPTSPGASACRSASASPSRQPLWRKPQRKVMSRTSSSARQRIRRYLRTQSPRTFPRSHRNRRRSIRIRRNRLPSSPSNSCKTCRSPTCRRPRSSSRV